MSLKNASKQRQRHTKLPAVTQQTISKNLTKTEVL